MLIVLITVTAESIPYLRRQWQEFHFETCGFNSDIFKGNGTERASVPDQRTANSSLDCSVELPKTRDVCTLCNGMSGSLIFLGLSASLKSTGFPNLVLACLRMSLGFDVCAVAGTWYSLSESGSCGQDKHQMVDQPAICVTNSGTLRLNSEGKVKAVFQVSICEFSRNRLFCRSSIFTEFLSTLLHIHKSLSLTGRKRIKLSNFNCVYILGLTERKQIMPEY